jgi:hypothetical protein
MEADTIEAYKGMIESIDDIKQLGDKVVTLLKRRMEKRLVKI